MRLLLPLLCCLTLLPLPGRAQVLVELFTSQGCSSCPPADALMGELAARDDVIALAYHVDYWDYLGWKDTFAKPAFSERQRQYAYTVDRQYIGRRLRGSFTPEAVIGGYDSLIGSSRQAIVSRIVAHQDMEQKVALRLARSGNALSIEVEPIYTGLPQARIMLARILPEATVEIGRGENRGRTLTYHRVVTELVRLGDWDGQDTVRLQAAAGDGPVVVFVQDGKAGPVLAVAESR